MYTLKLIAVCAVTIVSCKAVTLPDYIKPCSKSLPTDQLSECIVTQARIAQQIFVKGVPETNLESLDPLTLSDVRAKAGTFNIKSTNVVLKGLKKIDIREMKWNLEKKTGHTKLYGNLTFLSDYETDGTILLIPITGNGKLTVKLYDTEILIKFKIKEETREDGTTHVQTYDLKPSQKYGNVKIHMSNILGGESVGNVVNHVMNENWRELMKEVGPPFMIAVANKVHEVINKFYSAIPFDELLAQ